MLPKIQLGICHGAEFAEKKLVDDRGYILKQMPRRIAQRKNVRVIQQASSILSTTLKLLNC